MNATRRRLDWSGFAAYMIAALICAGVAVEDVAHWSTGVGSWHTWRWPVTVFDAVVSVALAAVAVAVLFKGKRP